MAATQNYSNHVRFDPPWHFFIAPAFLINLVVSIVATIRNWPDHSALFVWWIVMSIVGLFAVGRARTHSLAVQDRVIRLEERLRYMRLLSPSQLAAAEALTVRQIIALRFASDPELPSLVDRAAAEGLTPKQIKQAVVNWRPDILRA